MDAKSRICQIIDEKEALFSAVSDEIWEYAERRFDLKRSADKLCAVLAGEGFAVSRGCAGMEHAFIATYGSGTPVIGLLAEYDALSNLSQEAGLAMKKPLVEGGNGHGCGHNALGAGALAGAVGIKSYMEEAGISGTIKLYGCPAEEGGCGKTFMAREGLFGELDAILTWHPMTQTMVWMGSSLAVYQVCFKFKGISSHAAAYPHCGRSALDAVELMSVGVNYLREHIIQEARIHYAYIDAGGTAPNVVQPTAKVLYFVRAPRSSQLKEIFERVVNVAEGAAKMTGTTMELEWDSSCAEYIANDRLSRVMFANMELLGDVVFSEEDYRFAEQCREEIDDAAKAAYLLSLRTCFPCESAADVAKLATQSLLGKLIPFEVSKADSYGSTDVGDASWQAPTAQLVATCYPAAIPTHSWQYVACGKSSMVHKGLIYAGKVIAMTALDVLLDPQIVSDAKAEYLRRTASEKYHCPIPHDVYPQ